MRITLTYFLAYLYVAASVCLICGRGFFTGEPLFQ